MNKLKLQVGKKYRNRSAGVAEIIHYDKENWFFGPFLSDSLIWYKQTGVQAGHNEDEINKNDLIEEVA